jgi:predicted RNA-binding protein
MCLMTAQYNEALGGQVVMKNVTALSQSANGVRLEGLLDEPLDLPGLKVERIDFSRGITWLTREAG